MGFLEKFAVHSLRNQIDGHFLKTKNISYYEIQCKACGAIWRESAGGKIEWVQKHKDDCNYNAMIMLLESSQMTEEEEDEEDDED